MGKLVGRVPHGELRDHDAASSGRGNGFDYKVRLSAPSLPNPTGFKNEVYRAGVELILHLKFHPPRPMMH